MRCRNPAPILLALATSAVCGIACNPETTSVGGSNGTSSGGTGDSGSGAPVVCTPGEARCSGQAVLEICAPTGLEWFRFACPADEACIVCGPEDSCTRDYCTDSCDADIQLPSSAGCSFIASPQLRLQEDFPDSIIVVNPNDGLNAAVQLWRTPMGTTEEALVEEVTLAPGADHVFWMEQDFGLASSSMLRSGGTYRVESNVKVTAYQHAPGANHDGTESSLLLPEIATGRDYVVVSYSPHAEALPDGGRPSYFEIVALLDDTTVQWTPRVPTAGDGATVPFVPAGETGSVQMNRFDTLRIVASADFPDDVCDDLQDVSGTIVDADKPIWVVGGSRCSRVPVRGYVREGDDDTGCDWDSFPRRGFCDPLQEVLIPLEHWGRSYVAPRAPFREPLEPLGSPVRNYWRLYNGANGPNTITSFPAVFTDENCPPPNLSSMDGSQCTLPERGAWVEVQTPGDVNVKLQAEMGETMMAVGYLQSRWKGCELDPTLYDDPAVCVDEPLEEATMSGNPAMYQLVPEENFVRRTVVRTGEGYPHHFVQIIRAVDGPEVFLDAAPVQGELFEDVDGELEVATLEISEGAHALESSDPFGVLQIGHSGIPGHYEGCNWTGDAECRAQSADCGSYTAEDTCLGPLESGGGACHCRWVGGRCVDDRVCHSAYAHPGGMSFDQGPSPGA